MVKSANIPGVLELEEPIGFLTLDAADNKWTALVDGVAYDLKNNNNLLACSICGSSTEMRAWRAAFNCDTAVAITWQSTGGRPCVLRKDSDGYEVHIAPIGMGTFHLVAVSKRPDFLPALSDEAIWKNLNDRTTTPLCREWMPSLMQKLISDDALTVPTAHGRMKPGLLSVSTELIDKLVGAGLKHGIYRIVA